MIRYPRAEKFKKIWTFRLLIRTFAKIKKNNINQHHNNKTKMKSRISMLGTCVIGTLVLVSSCNLDIPQIKQTSFETMKIKKSDINVPYKFSAKMKGKTDVTVSPQVSGQLTQICVTEGQRVTKGQTLFLIDSRNARLDLENAQANLMASLAKESSARLEYESSKNLYDKKIISKYMLDDAYNDYLQAQASVAQARAQVDRSKVDLGFCTITAPVTGVIGEIPVRTGDQVSPSTYLTTLSGNTTMDAEFSLTESLVETLVSENVSVAQMEQYMAAMPSVTFVMKNGTEYKHKGRITSMTGVVNAATGTLAVKATFPNPDGQLISGIQGTVVLPHTATDAIVIPQVAVVKLQDKQQVYKVKADSTATAIDITTEDVGNGEDYIATSGLNVGDVIVTVGANNVHEGQKVLFPKEPENKK